MPAQFRRFGLLIALGKSGCWRAGRGTFPLQRCTRRVHTCGDRPEPLSAREARRSTATARRCVWRERQLAVVLVMSAAAPQGASGNKRTFNAHAALLRTSQYQYLSRRYSLQPSTSISHSRFMVAIPHLAPPSTAVAGGRLASASRPSCELKRERKRSLAREVLSSRCSRMQGWPGTRRLRLQSG